MRKVAVALTAACSSLASLASLSEALQGLKIARAVRWQYGGGRARGRLGTHTAPRNAWQLKKSRRRMAAQSRRINRRKQ